MRLMVLLWTLFCWLPVSVAAQESWVSFFRETEAGTVSVLVDLSVRRDGVQLASGYEVTMAVALSEPDNNGMTVRREAEILFKLEDALVADLAPLGGRFIGRSTGLAQRVFHVVFTGGADPGEAEAKMAALARDFGYAPRFKRETKAPLAAYEAELFPDAGGWRQIGDQQVILALQRAGDQAEVPRQITHWCVFSDKEKADRFQRWAGGVGYLEPVVMPGEGLWMVRFAHQGTVLPGDIWGHTVPLDETCRATGGQYDGWESPVVTSQ